MKNLFSILFGVGLVSATLVLTYSNDKLAAENNKTLEEISQLNAKIKSQNEAFDSYLECLKNKAQSQQDYLCVKPKHIIDYEREHPEVIKETLSSVKPVIKSKPQVKKVVKNNVSKPKVSKASVKSTVKSVKFNKKEAQKEVLQSLLEVEGFRPKAYRDGCLVSVKAGDKCPWGKERYSIGYGTLAKSKFESISKKEAVRRKSTYLQDNCYKFIPQTIKTKGDYILLSEICYNAGVGTMKSLLNKDGSVNYARYQNIIYSNGKINPALETRRRSFMIYALANGD